MTSEQAKDLGRKARQEIIKLDPRFADWEIFRRTLGFFSWKKKHALSDEMVDAFAQGFKEKPTPQELEN